MDSYTIPKSTVEAVGNYLIERPFKEVAALLELLGQSIKPVDLAGKSPEQFVAEQPKRAHRVRSATA